MSRINKLEKFTKYLSMVYGTVVTFLILLAILPKLIENIVREGIDSFSEISKSFVNWDDPTAFFFTYLIGYIIIWWKQLWGSLVIILGCAVYLIMEGIDGPLIFAAPAFFVGFFYLSYLLAKKFKV